jgi:hypothetical protein
MIEKLRTDQVCSRRGDPALSVWCALLSSMWPTVGCRQETDMAKQPANSGKRWTTEQDAQLRKEAAGNTPTRVIALHLERSEDAVRSRAADLDVSLKPTNQSPYGSSRKK